MGRVGIRIWSGRPKTPAAAMPVTNPGHDGFSLLAFSGDDKQHIPSSSWTTKQCSPAKIAACNKSLKMAIVTLTPSMEKSRGKRSEPAMERMQLRRLCVTVAARRVYCRQCGNINVWPARQRGICRIQ
jgi:hypothetical protein